LSKFIILAKRETLYEFQIEAETENEALDEMERIESAEDVEDYAYQWFPLEVSEIQEVK
jgi:hypothetical protein